MIKKAVALVGVSLLLSGCSLLPGFQQTQYALPADCEIKEIIALDAGFDAIDKTTEDAVGIRDCAIGIPNSDVGVFFNFEAMDAATWETYLADLKTKGYTEFASGVKDAKVWQYYEPGVEDVENCTIEGYVPGVKFWSVEPWMKCDDKWNKELVGYLVKHAIKK